MQRSQSGFTLIELMIVIAVLSILTVLAVMAYQDYSVRAKVGEAVSLTLGVKTSVSDYYQTNKRFPQGRGEAGVGNIDTKWVNNVTIIDRGTSGIISIDVDEVATGVSTLTIEDMYILLEAHPVTGGLEWECRASNSVDGSTTDPIITRLAPASCRN